MPRLRAAEVLLPHLRREPNEHNWPEYECKRNNYMCSDCRRKLAQASRLLTFVNGKQVVLYHRRKRPKPEDDRCELCERVAKCLYYHHWLVTEAEAIGM